MSLLITKSTFHARKNDTHATWELTSVDMAALALGNKGETAVGSRNFEEQAEQSTQASSPYL